MADGDEARRRRDLLMGKAWHLVKKDEGVFTNLKKWSARSGDHRRKSQRRETVAESSSDLKKRAAPRGIFDGALVGEHLGAMGSVSHRSIRLARHYSGLSTEDSTAAAMATVAQAIYGLIL